MKPKILIIGSVPPPFNGPSLAMQELMMSPHLREIFDVLFLDISDRRNPTNIGRFDLINMALGIFHVSKALGYILFRRPDLVYFGISQGIWGFMRDLGFLAPAILFRKNVVLHLRGSEFAEFFQPMPILLKKATKFLFAKVGGVIVLGNSLRKLFEGLVPGEKIWVVPNGIDYRAFKTSNGNGIAREGILFLSSLRRRKGIFLFIEAISLIRQRYPNIRVTIAGEWHNLGDKERALQQVKSLKLEDSLAFIGPVSGKEKIRIYEEHEAFVFPPVEPEGMPWVILEAMSAGLPVVTTAQGTIPEVVLDGRTGFIVEATAERIAERISFLLDNREVACKMGKEGRSRIEQVYSKECYLQGLESVFRSSLESSSFEPPDA